MMEVGTIVLRDGRTALAHASARCDPSSCARGIRPWLGHQARTGWRRPTRAKGDNNACRAWVDVDLIGYADTPERYYTPAQVFPCD